MSTPSPPPPPQSAPPSLHARPIPCRGPDYLAIQAWPFDQSQFFTRQFPRLLDIDVPQYVAQSGCRIWAFHDFAATQEVVGFGTLAICDHYKNYANAPVHPYIPVLGVNPAVKSRGYGQAIVEFLITQTNDLIKVTPRSALSHYLFLDVYRANERACNLYTSKCMFVTLNQDNPIPDPDENGEPYYVMARNVAESPA